jgi:hypothetical protein
MMDGTMQGGPKADGLAQKLLIYGKKMCWGEDRKQIKRVNPFPKIGNK